MILYTCGATRMGGGLPGPLAHPCGRAARALDDAGHVYDLQVVPGFKALPWTRTGDARARIRELTGQDDVPVLVAAGDEVVTGTAAIVAWAQRHPAGPRA